MDKVDTMSDPVARSINTSNAQPSLPSQAPKVKIMMQKNVSLDVNETDEISRASDKVIVSSDRSAISRCLR